MSDDSEVFVQAPTVANADLNIEAKPEANAQVNAEAKPEAKPEANNLGEQQTTDKSAFGRNIGKFTAFVKEITGSGTEVEEQEKRNNHTISVDPSSNHENTSFEPTTYKILGRTYTSTTDASARVQELLWLSYRCGFEPIPKSDDGPQPITFFPSIVFNRLTLVNLSNLRSLLDKDHFTSDAGWGCMIRTSQNLLANALLRLFHTIGGQPQKLAVTKTEADVIELFQDTLSAPFSLHNFIKAANSLSLNIKPGQWFGPSAASLSIKKLVNDYNFIQQERQSERDSGRDSGHKVPTPNLKLHSKSADSDSDSDSDSDAISKRNSIPYVYVSENCDLYDDEINAIFELEQRPILFLFPIRLGIEQVNKYYYSSILQILASKFSVGIAGGKPSSSFYFIGYEGEDDLIYFDPHLPQIVQTPVNLESYHTSEYSKLKIDQLDPSMMIGILIETIDEYQEFKMSCFESDNKILHFHPLVTTAPRESSINQSWEEVQGEEEFVNLNIVKNEEDFVDLGSASTQGQNHEPS